MTIFYRIFGCGWTSYAQRCRRAARSYDKPAGSDHFLGFRIFQEYV
jgi:formylglycine-generating enzyme required for sulfatase activity